MKRSEFDKIVKESVRKALEEIWEEEKQPIRDIEKMVRDIEETTRKYIFPCCPPQPSIPMSPWDTKTWC